MTEDPRLERLQAFVGEWQIEVRAWPLPPELAGQARMTFEWTLGGAFLLQRSSVPVPEAPDGLSVIAPDDRDGYTQHYFDSRGVVRIYAMTFDGRDWTLERNAPDFTPLAFHQRWIATVEADTVQGRWEQSPDGREWALDFVMIYTRVAR